MTFVALDIPHTCCEGGTSWASNQETPSEDGEEVEAEHAFELTLLEELLSEFEGNVVQILQDPNLGVPDLIHFWEHTWTIRMNEVCKILDGNDLDGDEIQRAEAVGIVWDMSRPKHPPPASKNPYSRDEEEYWFYELEWIQQSMSGKEEESREAC